jgi:23S rRNA pseudouridine1911/1915/1917 synthase
MMYGNAKKFFITAKNSKPLLALLKDHLPADVSAEKVLNSGAVWFNRKRLLDPAIEIAAQETVLAYSCHTQGQYYALASDAIIFENDDFLAVHKPPGITSISDRSNLYWNLTHGVHEYLRSQGSSYVPSAINRLDFMVRGLALYAKNKATEKQLFRLTEKRRIGKIYMALVEKQSKPVHCLRVRDSLSFLKRAFADPEGKPSHSLFIYRSSQDIGDFYSVVIFSGRRHQIRFHASQYLSPIIGDTYYKGSIRTPNQHIGLVAMGYNFRLYGKRYHIRLPNPEQVLGNCLKGKDENT